MMTNMASIRETVAVRVNDTVRPHARARRRAPRAPRPEEHAVAPMLLAAALRAAGGDHTRLWFSKDGGFARILNRPRSEGLPTWLDAEETQPSSTEVAR